MRGPVLAGKTFTSACALIVGGTMLPAWPETARAGSIIEIATPADLQRKFCAADPGAEHILVLPAGMFVDARELVCPAGPYKLYRILESKDPDDFDYYIDPPFGARGRLACDGKAGRTMGTVAVNCRPL